jgi:hypothetical protein
MGLHSLLQVACGVNINSKVFGGDHMVAYASCEDNIKINFTNKF